MRNLKRALSLALASVMLVGMMVVGTSAASFPDVDSNDNVEAIEVLNAVEVMIGDNGDFRPDDTVTRNEMAVIMAKLILGKDADNYVGTHPFTDVPEWADKYVAACYNEGIVAGREETVYDGQATVTAEEAAAMMLRALGYEKLEKIGQGYPAEIVKRANQISLFKDVGSNPKAPMTRNQIAQLSLNTLKSTVVTSDIEEGIIIEGVVTMPTKATYTNMPTSAATSSYEGKLGSNTTIELGEKLYEGKLEIASTSQSDDLGRPADLWKYNSKEVVKVAKEADTTIVVEKNKALVDVLKDENKDYYVTTSGTPAAPDALAAGQFTASNLFVNGTGTAGGSVNSDGELKVGDIVEIFTDANDGNKITKVVVTQYTLAKVDKVDTNISSSDAKDGVTCKLTLKNGKDSGLGTFKDTDFAGYNAAYEKDTYLAVVIKGSKVLDSYVVEPAAEGKVSAYDANKEYTIDGTKYKAVRNADFAAKGNGWKSNDFDGTYAAYTDSNGYLIGIVEVEAGKAASDAVYVVKLWDDSSAGSFGAKVTTTYAQVVDMDGTVTNDVVIGRTNDKGEIFGLDKDGKAYTLATGITGDSNIAATHFYVTKDGVIKAATATTCPDDAVSGTTATTIKFYTKAGSASVVAQKLYTVEENTDDKINDLTAYTEKVSSGALTVAANTGEIKSDATRLGDYNLDGDTKYIVAEKDGDDLEVTVVTGGLSYKNKTSDANPVTVIYRESGRSKIADYVILSVGKFNAGDSEDMLYIDSVGSKTKDGYLYTVYMPDGSKEEIEAKGNVAKTANKFYTWSMDGDLYELSNPVSEATDLTNDTEAWDDGNTGVAYDVLFERYLNDRLDIKKGSYILSNIKTDSIAAVIDLHETEQDDYDNNATAETYSGTVSDLDAINGLDSSYVVTMDVNVTKDGVAIVIVTDISRGNVSTLDNTAMDKSGTQSITGITVTAGGAAATVNGNVTVDNSAKTITIAYNKGTANTAGADTATIVTVKLTDTTASFVASGSNVTAHSGSGDAGTFTLTKGAGGWKTDNKLTVTAANGTSTEYSITINETNT